MSGPFAYFLDLPARVDGHVPNVTRTRTCAQSAASRAAIDELPVRIFDEVDQLHGQFDFKRAKIKQ